MATATAIGVCAALDPGSAEPCRPGSEPNLGQLRATTPSVGGPIEPPLRLTHAGPARGEAWVRATIALLVLALLFFAFALPIPGPSRHAAQAERRLVEVQLVLSELRAVLHDFRADHGAWPGEGRDGHGDPSLLQDQIARPTGRDGEVLRAQAAGGRPERVRGPYRNGGVPANPANGLSSVRFLAAEEAWPTEADGMTGWLYRPSTGEIRANAPGRAFRAAPRYLDL